MLKQEKNFTIFKLFTYHPHSIGESFSQHFRFAFRNGFRMLYAGCACIIHSFFPFLFVSVASDTVKKINQELVERKNKVFIKNEQV